MEHVTKEASPGRPSRGEAPGASGPHASTPPPPIFGVEALLDDYLAKRYWPRRLLAEFLGTYLLVIAAAGAPMMAQAIPGSVSRMAAVVAPGLTVMAVILATGKISGAHLNPGVSMAFALRGDFPWGRVPGYVGAQLTGALAAAATLQGLLGVSARYGATYPAGGFTPASALALETLLTFGLVTIVLGTASGAQNIGVFGSIGVGAYIALAGMWGSPLSGASMNPVRSLGPMIVAGDYRAWWVYVAGPLLGAGLATGAGYLLRGPGGGKVALASAQGDLERAENVLHRAEEERRPYSYWLHSTVGQAGSRSGHLEEQNEGKR